MTSRVTRAVVRSKAQGGKRATGAGWLSDGVAGKGLPEKGTLSRNLDMQMNRSSRGHRKRYRQSRQQVQRPWGRAYVEEQRQHSE